MTWTSRLRPKFQRRVAEEASLSKVAVEFQAMWRTYFDQRLAMDETVMDDIRPLFTKSGRQWRDREV